MINEPRTGDHQTMFSKSFRWRAAGAYLLKIKYVSSTSTSAEPVKFFVTAIRAVHKTAKSYDSSMVLC